MSEFLETAVLAAREAGALIKEAFGDELEVHAKEAHDIKLALDVQAQELIERVLLGKYPDHAILGEEGDSGSGAYEWIVDPIDGTVNFFYGIPHFCVSIALRHAGEMLVGVVHDPMRDELWCATKGGTPTLNGKPIRVSARAKLSDAVVTVGFSKNVTTMQEGLPLLERMVHRVRKCRLFGSAALDLAYVASGRLDAYIERGVNLWDVAAGMLLVETAGGKFRMRDRADLAGKLSVVASNGLIDPELAEEGIEV